MIIRKNNIEMYSTDNEERPVVGGKFIKTLKTKTYKYMSSMSKYIYVLIN